MDYKDATSFLSKGRNKTRRPLSGRASEMIARDNGDIAIKYQATDVVTFHSDNTITLNSDGWRTVTTKARINEYTRANVNQRNGLWYMSDGSLFYDGVRIRENGSVVDPKQPEDSEAAKREVDKLVSHYVTAFRKQIEREGKLPEPSDGDCCFCSMTVESPEKDRGKSLGEANRDTSHILSHLQEQYIFGSILWRAIQRRGNPAVCWQYGNSCAAKGDGSFLMSDLRYYLRQQKQAFVEQLQQERSN